MSENNNKTAICPDCGTVMDHGLYGISETLLGNVVCGGFKCPKCDKRITDIEAAESFKTTNFLEYMMINPF